MQLKNKEVMVFSLTSNAVLVKYKYVVKELVRSYSQTYKFIKSLLLYL